MRALQWTDTRGDEEGDDGKPAQYDPFVSLSERGRDPPPAPLQRALSEGGRGDRKRERGRELKAHKMVSDQLINLISAPYAVGHIGKDMGLQYSTREYVWGKVASNLP